MLKEKATKSRIKIIDMIYGAQSGHPGGSLSCIDILTYLLNQELKLNRDNANSLDRDRLVLSKGHGAPALYAGLHSEGVILEEELGTFRKIDSNLQGHPNMNDTDGVDMSTGSLGQGISVAVGMALADKYKGNDHYVYALCGDGEFEEGQVYEALIAIVHYNLNRLIVILDNNGLQIDGPIHEVMNPAPFKDKFQAFGFEVIEIDGHNFDEIASSVQIAKANQKPTIIIAKTVKGKGVSFMENQAGWHGKAPNCSEYDLAMDELKGSGING